MASLRRWYPLTKTLFVLIITILAGQLYSYVFEQLFHEPIVVDVRNPTVIIAALLFAGLMALLAFAGCALIDRRPLSDFGFAFQRRERRLAALSVILITAVFTLMMILLRETGAARWMLRPILPKNLLAAVLIYISVGINEEIFFRGYLFRSLLPYGKVAAYVICILVFTLVHFSNQTMSVPYLLVLILMTLLYVAMYDFTGSLLPGIIFHSTYDLLLAILGGNTSKGSFIYWSSLRLGVSLNDLFMFASILVIILMGTILWFHQRNRSGAEPV